MHHQMIAERCPLAWNSVPALVWHSFELFEQITKAIRKRRSTAGFIFSLQALVYLAQPQPSKSSCPSCPCEFRLHRATTKGATGSVPVGKSRARSTRPLVLAGGWGSRGVWLGIRPSRKVNYPT